MKDDEKMTIQGAYQQIKEWELPFYCEPSRRKVLETIEEHFDAVHVIRCNDCKHLCRLFDGSDVYYECKYTGDVFSQYGRSRKMETWYCAAGERKDGEQDGNK